MVSNVRIFQQVIDQTVGKDKNWPQRFNLSQWATYLTCDIMGELIFGRRFECLTSNEHRYVPQMLMNGITFLYTVSHRAMLAFHSLELCYHTHSPSAPFASVPLGPILRLVLASGVLSLPLIGGTMARDERRFYEYSNSVSGDRIADEDKISKRDYSNARKRHHALSFARRRSGDG